jgi:hypothetical protein
VLRAGVGSSSTDNMPLCINKLVPQNNTVNTDLHTIHMKGSTT